MVTWERPDILANFCEIINYPLLLELRQGRMAQLERAHWEKLRSILSRLPMGTALSQRSGPLPITLSQAAISVGAQDILSPSEMTAVKQAIDCLIPWRKGPFSLFGIEIDSEWQSDKKWARIAPRLDSLAGKNVLDVGCGNGYYMFRAAADNPECVIGIDPSEAFFYAFELFQRFIQLPNVQYELMGSEDLHCFGPMFDVVLCLGVVYHQKSPLELLQSLGRVMKPGAQLILESQGIPLDGPYALFPEARYAKARNVYFVPTADCMCAWLARAGFREIEVFSSVPVVSDEQRATSFAPYESLSDFLDPNDSTKTIEGYPAPYRIAVHARK